MKKCNWNFPRPELDNRFGHQINSNSCVALPSFSLQRTLLTEVGCFCRLFRKPATPNDRAIAFHSSMVPPLLTRSSPENVSSVLKRFPSCLFKLPAIHRNWYILYDIFIVLDLYGSFLWGWKETECGPNAAHWSYNSLRRCSNKSPGQNASSIRIHLPGGGNDEIKFERKYFNRPIKRQRIYVTILVHKRLEIFLHILLKYLRIAIIVFCKVSLGEGEGGTVYPLLIIK